MKKSSILFSENEENKISKTFKDKTTFENVTTFYEIAAFYRLQNLSNGFLCYIERLFTVVAETENFLQLSFALVSKILTSSSLHITSELEVFNALDKWLSHNYEERKVFANSLLLKVRLCLLSKNSLKCLLNEGSALTRNDDCVTILQNVLKGENRYHQSKLATRYIYCDQYKFEILFCGGRSDYSCLQSVYKVDGTNKSKLDTTDA